MKIVNPNTNDDLNSIIAPIDDSTIMKLVKIAFECKKDTEIDVLRDKLYQSTYSPTNLEQKELDLENFLNQKSQRNSNIRTSNQNKEYKWVKINTQNMEDIYYRFYIAPNPDNLHELVKRLVEAFEAKQTPVRFKYQLTTKMESCDRIIIYSDFTHKKDIEQAIKSVYQQYPHLFDGCERSLAWFYPTEVPDVYIAPETPGEAYSNKVAQIIKDARETFNYLYGITNANSKIRVDGNQATEYMKMLITSIMFRNGILLLKDGRSITIKDKNVKCYYDYDTGILEHCNSSNQGFDSVQFLPTFTGRDALLKNFYSVSKIKPQEGLITKHLTPKERQEEVYRALYPHKFTQSSPTNKGKKL